jgi:hypothetical protein
VCTCAWATRHVGASFHIISGFISPKEIRSASRREFFLYGVQAESQARKLGAMMSLLERWRIDRDVLMTVWVPQR